MGLIYFSFLHIETIGIQGDGLGQKNRPSVPSQYILKYKCLSFGNMPDVKP